MANNNLTTLQRTDHSVRRQQQRGITRDLVALALRFGKRYHVGGGRIAYYLGRRHFPQDSLRHWPIGLRGSLLSCRGPSV